MTLRYPLILLGLPVVALFVAWAAWRLRRVFRHRHLLFAGADTRSAASVRTLADQLRRIGVLGAALALLLVALAHPLGRPASHETSRTGVNALLLIDASRSMGVEDAFPNRLDRAKAFALELLPRLAGSRVGVMTYSGGTTLMAPLSFDTVSAQVIVGSITTELAGKGGTSLGPALERARRYLEKDTGKQPRVILVFSDGENHDGDAVLAAMQARTDAGVIVHTLVVGTTAGGPVPIFTRDAQRELQRTGTVTDATGAAVISRANPAELRDVAERTGGLALQVPAGGSLLPAVERLVQEGISPHARELGEARDEQRVAIFWMPLALAIGLLLGEGLWPRPKGPAESPGSAPRPRARAFARSSSAEASR